MGFKELDLIEKPCVVAAFGMRLLVRRDGDSDRGLWFWMREYVPDIGSGRRHVEAATLLEWRAMEEVYKTIGKELARRRMIERSANPKRKVGRQKKAPPRYELIRQETRKPALFPPAETKRKSSKR